MPHACGHLYLNSAETSFQCQPARYAAALAAVWTGKRHGRAGQVVQQGPDLVLMQVLMSAYSSVTRHHGQQMVGTPGANPHRGCRLPPESVRSRGHPSRRPRSAFRPGQGRSEAIGSSQSARKAQGCQAWQTRGDPLRVSRTEIKHGRKQHLLRFMGRCGAAPVSVVEHALVCGVLIDQEDPMRILQHKVRIVELSQRCAFENSAPGFRSTRRADSAPGQGRRGPARCGVPAGGTGRGGRCRPQHRHGTTRHGKRAWRETPAA